MTKQVRVVAAWLLLGFILTTCITGCWNRREPENMHYALGFAFDIDDEGLYTAHIQIPNPEDGNSGGNGQQAGGSAAHPSWTVSAKGETPYQAIFGAFPFLSKELSVAHVGVVIISEKLARQGIGPILDLLERERTLRISSRVLVAKGDVGKIMSVSVPLDSASSLSISRALSILEKDQSIIPFKDATHIIDTLAQPGKEPMVFADRGIDPRTGQDHPVDRTQG